jgi:hypothetical protein
MQNSNVRSGATKVMALGGASLVMPYRVSKGGEYQPPIAYRTAVSGRQAPAAARA